MKVEYFLKKIKQFIHKHENLEKLALASWSIFQIARIKFIFRKIKHQALKGNFKVIILGVRTIPTTNLVYFDAIFGQAFKKLGCEVKMLYCDGVLDSCDADTIFRNQKPQCFVCKKFGNCLKNSLNLDCISYHQYISNSDIEKIKKIVAGLDDKELLDYEYLGLKVGVHAQSSAIRYFLFGKLDLNDPAQVAVLRKKLVYAMIAAKVAEGVVKEEKPDLLFMLHGVYSTWGPFFAYFRLKGIDTVIYGNAPLRLGHFAFGRNIELTKIISKQDWANFSRFPLEKEKEEQINAYFNCRIKGETGDQEMFKANFNTNIKKNSLLESLSKKRYLRRYVLYPNLAWDVGIEGKISEIFDDVFSWIDTNIEFFKNKKDYQLIIKPHPAELVWEGCSRSIGDYIREKHQYLPENITLLRPDVPLSAYDLARPDSICLVFNGTLGLELAALGVPVLVAAQIHYREAGVVKKVETLEQYLRLLENPDDLISFTKNNIELAKKYAYFYFFKSMIRIPFYRDDKWSIIDWKKVAKSEELFDKNSNIIKICQKIIDKKDVVNPL